MHQAAHHRQATASPRRSVAAWGLWLLRWSLVLLLMADQMGAPLHHHHHDAGFDGPWATAAADEAADGVLHIGDADHADHFSHSTLVVRGSSENLRLSAVADDDAFVFFQYAATLALLAMPVADDASRRPPPRWLSPFISAHRSLPPAGRAPPLHA